MIQHNSLTDIKVEPGQLTANQRFRCSDLVSDFVTVILFQSEGLGKLALGIVKYAYDRSFQLIGVILVRGQFVRGQFVTVSCCGPHKGSVYCTGPVSGVKSLLHWQLVILCFSH